MSGHVGFVVDKVVLGRFCSKYFGLPLSIFIPPTCHRLLHIHHLSFGAGTIGQIVAAVPSGLISLTAPQGGKKKLNSASPLVHNQRYRWISKIRLVYTATYNNLQWQVPFGLLKQSPIFWDIPSCSQLKINWRFGGTCRLNLQGWRVSHARNQHEANSLLWLLFNPENGDMFLRNVSWFSTDHTALYPRQPKSPLALLWEPHLT
jgi:hypothetical protein